MPPQCEHPFDALHYISEGFDIIRCSSCGGRIAIHPVETPESDE